MEEREERFELRMRDGKMFFVCKSEKHGNVPPTAEVLFRKQTKYEARPKKRPKKITYDVMQIRCPSCFVYQEGEFLGKLDSI